VVSFTPWYPFGRSLGGPHRQSGHGGKGKNPCPSLEFNPHHPHHKLGTFPRAYPKAELKNNGNKASPCFRPF